MSRRGRAVVAQLFEAELAWSVPFEQGRYTDPAVPSGTGERVATRIADAVVADLGFGNPPVVERIHCRGPVVATDRRIIVVAPDGSIAWECLWSPHIMGVVGGQEGTVVFPDDDAQARGARVWGIVAPALVAATASIPDGVAALRRTLSWRRVDAAWHLSRGTLDRWRDETAATAAQIAGSMR